MRSTGTRLEVWRGGAEHTAGGLRRSDLTVNKFGHLVSKKASLRAKERFNGRSRRYGGMTLKQVFRMNKAPEF